MNRNIILLFLLIGMVFLAGCIGQTPEELEELEKEIFGEEVECPEISNVTNLDIYLGISEGGEEFLYLSPEFLRYIQVSEGWKLENPPIETDIEYFPFPCEKGSLEGESVNKLYCRVGIAYEPFLKKSLVALNGTVIRTDYLYIEKFVFDTKEENIKTKAAEIDNKKLEKEIVIDRWIRGEITADEASELTENLDVELKELEESLSQTLDSTYEIAICNTEMF
jgi:hypothetical protein